MAVTITRYTRYTSGAPNGQDHRCTQCEAGKVKFRVMVGKDIYVSSRADRYACSFRHLSHLLEELLEDDE